MDSRGSHGCNDLQGDKMNTQRTAITLEAKDRNFYEKTKADRSLFYSDLVLMGLDQVRKDRMKKKAEWIANGYLNAKISFYRKDGRDMIFSIKCDFGRSAKIVKPIRLISIEKWGEKQYIVTYFLDGKQKESKVPVAIVSEEILGLMDSVILAIDTINKATEG